MSMMIDLRSDTVTVPTENMRRAMAESVVGDDVMGEDPTVHALQERGAELFGKEAGLFLASGSMTNQVTVLTMCQKGEQIVVSERSHMYNMEVAGLASICQVQARSMPTPGGRYDLARLESEIHTPAIQAARTAMICLENTYDLNQGRVIDKAHIDEVAAVAHKHGLPLYIDGARIFNAAVALNTTVKELCTSADLVGVCLSKGLGCPIGSLLLGPRDKLEEAKRMRQMLGGGWRQAGVIAAAGLVGLGEMIERLADDHENAQALAKGLAELGLGIDMEQVQTNVIRIDISSTGKTSQEYCPILQECGVKAKPIEPYAIRMIAHKDLDKSQVPAVLEAVAKSLKACKERKA